VIHYVSPASPRKPVDLVEFVYRQRCAKQPLPIKICHEFFRASYNCAELKRKLKKGEKFILTGANGPMCQENRVAGVD
jgi:hypothetical protein